MATDHLVQSLFSNEKLWSEELKDPGRSPTAPIITPHLPLLSLSPNKHLIHPFPFSQAPRVPNCRARRAPLLAEMAEKSFPLPRCSLSTSSLSTSSPSFYTAMMTRAGCFSAELPTAETNREDGPLGKWGWQVNGMEQRDSVCSGGSVSGA